MRRRGLGFYLCFAAAGAVIGHEAFLIHQANKKFEEDAARKVFIERHERENLRYREEEVSRSLCAAIGTELYLQLKQGLGKDAVAFVGS